MVCKEQRGKIYAPFPVDFVCVEILIQFIIEYLMWFSVLIFRLLGTDDGTESKFCIHIFMNGCTAYISSLTTKIYLHGIHHHENDKYHEWKPLSWLYYDDMLFFGFSNNYSRHLDKY